MLGGRLGRRHGQSGGGLSVFGPQAFAVGVLKRVLVMGGGLGGLGGQVIHVLPGVKGGVVAVALGRFAPSVVVVVAPAALVISLWRFDKLGAFASLKIGGVVVVGNDL